MLNVASSKASNIWSVFQMYMTTLLFVFFLSSLQSFFPLLLTSYKTISLFHFSPGLSYEIASREAMVGNRPLFFGVSVSLLFKEWNFFVLIITIVLLQTETSLTFFWSGRMFRKALFTGQLSLLMKRYLWEHNYLMLIFLLDMRQV